jgi:TonB-linked SusC/RagA family outer membrane protein
MLAQQTKISGSVTDSKSDVVMPGVNVVVKGTSTGTVTDLEGKFALTVDNANAVLTVSFVGYVTQEIALQGGGTNIKVVLTEDVTEMDQVVVVGYGSQRKSDITGAVAVVNTENIQKIATNDISKALQGQTSGVQVFGGGEPGAQQRVQIRGVGTFGNTDPLYVIDGVPIAAPTAQGGILYEDHAVGFGGDARQGGIADFNPADIESIQILKDASSAAIYGSRGANGVIIITTKRGKAGESKITYEGSYGVQNIAKRMDMTNRVQFQTLYNEARANEDRKPTAVNDTASQYYIDNINTDWQKEAFKQGNIANQTLSYRGGTENNSYYGSLGYFDQTGTFVGHGPRYTKYNAQMNLDQKKGRLKLSQSISYTYSSQIRLTNFRWDTYMNDLLRAIPTVPVHDTSNIGGFGFTNSNYGQTVGNPIAFNSLTEVTFQRQRFLGNVSAELEILKSLSYKINLSYDHSSWYNEAFQPIFEGDKYSNTIATLDKWRGENPVMVMEHLLNFKQLIGKHDIDAVLGYTAQQDFWEDLHGKAQGFEAPYKEYISTVPASSSSATDGRWDHAMISYLGRLNYGYDDKYLLTGSIRRDYSSNFGAAHKYGDFPSFSLGWKVSNETFFKDEVPVVNKLMIRGGYGVIGNENIGKYLYESFVNANATYFLGQPSTLNPGTILTRLRDPSIKWEERKTSNIGFDMAMFKNKVEVTAEYYHNDANGILVPINIPWSSGIGGAVVDVANAANMTNQGVEISVAYKKFDGDFHYQIGANITTTKNTVTKIGTDNTPRDSPTGSARTEVGRSVGELFGYETDGVFQSDAEINTKAPGVKGYDSTKYAFINAQTKVGDIKFKDLNHDGIIDANDRTYLGVTIPKLNYGINLSADYKGIDISVFIQGIYGNKVYNHTYQIVSSLGKEDANYTIESYNNRWTPTNHSNTWPRATVLDNNGNNRFSNRWVQDGSYLKMQNVQIGYTFPKSILHVPGIESLRIYVQGQNLFAISKMWGYDPDFINDGLEDRGYANGSIPSPRTYLVGLKVGL